MIPQLLAIILMTLGLGMNIAAHKKERTPTNAWTSFVAVIIWATILYWGGFFDNF